jgi:hypothetical protein
MVMALKIKTRKSCAEANSLMCNFVEVSGHTLEVSVYNDITIKVLIFDQKFVIFIQF